MNTSELFRVGRPHEAIDSWGVELPSNPTDAQRRTFLFELLCFSGSYDHAEKQLDVLASGNEQVEMGILLDRSALHATRLREQQFGNGDALLPKRPKGSLPVLTPFAWEDASDPVRLGQVTEWGKLDSRDVIPIGQKMIVADDCEYAFHDIREISIDSTSAKLS